MWGSSFTHTLSWLMLGQAQKRQSCPPLWFQLFVPSSTPSSVLTSICVAMWGSGSGHLSERKQYSSPKSEILGWEKVARDIGRVELLVLAVTSAYTGSKCVWNFTPIIETINGTVTEMLLGKAPAPACSPRESVQHSYSLTATLK